MHKIERIRVHGFWDTYNFETELFPDVTFFIGANGTGKTTFINLIAAVLFGDFGTLERISFESIEILLDSGINKQKPTITVVKKKTRGGPLEDIQYRIRETPNGEEKVFSLDELSEHMLLRGVEFNFARAYERQLANRRRQPQGLADTIRALVDISWLSIHRISSQTRSTEDRSLESTVDRKLEQQSTELVKYFSSVSREKDEEVRHFQEQVFVSLLEEPSTKSLFSLSNEKRLPGQRASLVEIFRELNVPAATYKKSLDAHFDNSHKLYEKIRVKKQQQYSMEEVANLLGLVRLNEIVERWHQLQTRIADVFAQRNKFLQIVNELYLNKTVTIRESNELSFVSKSDKQLGLKLLSSGEKQLLILLTEALLQRGKPYIFIADEPELSLHVAWQERLISSLTTLNSAAQIIVATHSPDIIGNKSSNVINMEALIP